MLIPGFHRLLRVVLLSILIAPGFVSSARAGGGGGYSLDGIQVLVATGNYQLDIAERYALAVLGSDYDGSAHVAAANYYTNPWVRDSFAWGMVPSLRDVSVGSYSSGELSYWLSRQQPFGGWVTAPKSGYFDETPILISAVLDSYTVTGDVELVRHSIRRLERGWNWLEKGFIKPTHGSRYLIYANVPPHVAADWADQVGRRGYATQLEALWYRATMSMGVMEALSGDAGKARAYARFAVGIRKDINRLLWTTSAPIAHDAPAVAAFGHYRSWIGKHDYFELDSNFLCIVYGIATPAQSSSIVRFVEVHQGYLLGIGTANGVPARVLYGDYLPPDYAGKHERLAPGQYQNAYWPTVGALVAIGLAHAGDVSEARDVLAELGNAFARDGDVREWYTQAGAGKGAPTFGWAARLFLVALYAAYLGVDEYVDYRGAKVFTGIRLSKPAGEGTAEIAFRGHMVRVSVLGQGSMPSITIDGRTRAPVLIPASALCAGCTVDARWG
jgi:hypothetical protein